jgi:hypothetical protein
MTRTVALLAAIAFLGGCGDEQTSTPTGTTVQLRPQALASSAQSAAVNQDLATLRQVTASFHDFATASAAGWSAQITPCMESPEGGMGFHYGNVGLIDGTARVDQPELLLYEPESNGRLRLVAVEYIIPYTFHSRDAAPPVLFGQEFQQVDAFQLWGLHAWVWKNNPSGTFAPWNPQVNCANATATSRMSH